MSHWATQYIGLPWASGAQGPAAFDCWALVRHIQREHFGHDLPLIDVDAQDLLAVHAAFQDRSERAHWSKVDAPQAGDGVLLHKGNNADHVGVWVDVDGGMVLHALPGIGVVCTQVRALSRLGWGPIEFYRHI